MTVNKTLTGKEIAQVFAGTGGAKRLLRFAKKNDAQYWQFISAFKDQVAAIIITGGTAAPVDNKAATDNLVTILKNMHDAQRREAADEEARTGMRTIDGVKFIRADRHHDLQHAASDQTPAPPPDGLKPPKPPPDVTVDVLPANVRKKYFTPSGALITELNNGTTICQPPSRGGIYDDGSRDVPISQTAKPSTDGITSQPISEVQRTRRVRPDDAVGLWGTAANGFNAQPDFGINFSQQPAYNGRRFP
jgi:hypothetical protein